MGYTRKRRGGKRPAPWLWIVVLLVVLAGGLFQLVPELGDGGGDIGGSGGQQIGWEDFGRTFDALFIDVGQGDAILIGCQGRYMLVDAGVDPKGTAVLEALELAGVARLDLVAATHPHADHIGGMAAVLDAYPADLFIMPDAAHTTKTFSNMLDALERNGCDAEYGAAGQTYALGGATIRLLWPEAEADFGGNLNNASLVMAVAYDGVSLLLTGDAEQAAEAAILKSGLGGFDLLKAGHHGSRTSTTDGFLAAADPTHVVISCGAGNDYGHPHDETLARLADRKIWRTDRQGGIRAHIEAGELTVYGTR